MSRELPLALYEEDNIFLDTQREAERQQAANIWAMRAGLELSVSAGYAIILRELLEYGAEKPVLALCAESAVDEIQHAQWCLDLAERIDGKPRPWPAPTSLHVPSYSGIARGPMLAALHLVAMSCLNETIACERLLEAMRPTKLPSARLTLKRILSDEIKHARAGWAHLASRHVTAEMKQVLGTMVPFLIQSSLVSLIEENETIPSEEFSQWGLPCVDEARAQAQRAIDQIVLPGFAQLSIPCILS
jgi:hypothetical protein